MALQSIFLRAQKNETLPDIEEVARKFYSNYAVDDSDYQRVDFEKRPEGWFVVSKKIVNQALEDDKRQLFYSLGEKDYRELHFRKGSKSISDVSEYIDQYEVQWFRLYPCYGYNGWYKDLIKKFEGENELPDNSLYLLARAYSTFANSLLSDQFGYSIPEESFHPPLKMNSLTQAQIGQYEQVCRKAISLFKQLKERNPSFETTVGSISIKYANEEMARFHSLTTYAPDYAREITLPDKIYPDSIIEMVRSWMDACSKNGIFISFGDNDFYPFLYLQQHDRYRRDLYVVNYSLLALSPFIYGYAHTLFDAPGVGLGADTSLYAGTHNNYMYLNESDTVYSMAQLIDRMRKQKDHQALELGGNTFSIKYGKDETNNGATISLNANVRIDGKYILKNQWVLLDIINNLKGREIDFPSEFTDELKNLNNLLQWTGKVYRYKNF